MNELRIALRHHVRRPGFAATVVSTLGLTIGATTAVFSVVNGVLIGALPFPSAERLVWVASVRADNPSAPFSLPEFMDYRRSARTLAGLAAYANWSASLAGDGVTERFQGARMSANAFDVLGVTPSAGRLLVEADDGADAPRVVLLSHDLWKRRYGGVPDVVGTTVRINAEPYTIVGVLPAQFPLPLRGIDVVTPLAPDRDPLRHQRNSVNFLMFFGRLRDGTDAREAESELTAICHSLRRQFPVEYARKESVRVTSLHERLVGDHRQSMILLMAAVVVVLGAALANLASLALVRATGRYAELSMRIAMGASRFQLLRQLAVEVLLLVVVGSGLGWWIAARMVQEAIAWAPSSVPRLSEVRLDTEVALFLAGVGGLVTLVLTATPLGAISRTQAGDALRQSSRGALGDRFSHRLRNTLVVSEIAAAVVLLLPSVVLLQNLLRLRHVDPGFDPNGVFQARVSVPPSYRSPEEVSRFYDRLSERLVASPSVEEVGLVSVAPLSGLLATVPFSIPEHSTGEREGPSANLRAITPGYLSTVGTRLLAGRMLSDSDRPTSPPVALVSAALADRFLSGKAVGARLLIDDNNDGPRPVEIVGVVENVRQSALDLPMELDIYLPLAQIHPDGIGLVRNNQFWMVRTESDPEAFRTTFLTHLRAVDPDAAVSGAGGMRQHVDAWLGPRRFQLGLLAGFATTAVLLAVTGLYGLVSYAVSARTREIGLRMAVGATERDAERLILRQAFRLGASGAAVGLGVALSLRALVSRAIGDASLDPAAAAGAAAFLTGVLLLAAWIPARRAARVEPTLALRAQ